MNFLLASFYASGAFAVILGVLHFTFPKRFGLLQALPSDDAPLPPFRLWLYRYDMKRSDLRGIVYVMNHCVSYVIIVTGVFDLFADRWLGTVGGAFGAMAVAGLWAVRASTQFYLGHRRGDWLAVACFGVLTGIHAYAAVFFPTSG